MVLKDLVDTIGLAREIYGIGPTDLFSVKTYLPSILVYV